MTEQIAKKKGRPPQEGATLVDGKQWVLSTEALEKAALRLEKHRTDCRDRYRRTQDALREQRPDLFVKRRTAANADDLARLYEALSYPSASVF